MKKLFASLFVPVGAAGAFADDWPQWMGNERDAIWREAGVRKDLPKEGAKVLWRAPVGLGYAGPAVAKGKVYVPDFVITDGEFDGKSQGGQPRTSLERIVCLDAETGEPLWKHEHEVTYTVSYPGGPRVTPTVADGRLYFQGTMGQTLDGDPRHPGSPPASPPSPTCPSDAASSPSTRARSAPHP